MLWRPYWNDGHTLEVCSKGHEEVEDLALPLGNGIWLGMRAVRKHRVAIESAAMKSMKFFLKLKAWQLFLLNFGLPAGLLWPKDIPFVLGLFATLVIVAVLIGWLWTVGTQLNKKVPEKIRMKSGLFRFSLIYISIYIPCGFVFFALTETGSPASSTVAIILPFQFFAMFCWFYGCYFVSKNFAMAERKQETIFPDFARLFFLLLLYPMGLWSIQPRVNRMFENELGYASPAKWKEQVPRE